MSLWEVLHGDHSDEVGVVEAGQRLQLALEPLRGFGIWHCYDFDGNGHRQAPAVLPFDKVVYTPVQKHK